jgi:thimet oligopeptidase
MSFACKRLIALLLLSVPVAGVENLAAQTAVADPLHAWKGGNDPAKFESWINQRLAAEKAAIDKLLAVSGACTVENTLRPFDDAQNQLAIAGNNAYLLFSLGDTAPLRDKAQAMESVVASAQTDLGLNQKVYRRLASIPAPANNPATRHYLERTLLEYRLAGVDKDDATRDQIRALQDRITALSLTFVRNISDGTLKIAASKAELDGLPDDFIAKHPPAADGTYILTTDEPDVVPVLAFANSAELRKRTFLTYSQRAYPKNVQVLHDLLTARQQLATILGYPHFADLYSADQMTGSVANITALLDQVDAASRDIDKREYAQLLQFARQRNPGLTGLSEADRYYWSEQFRRANFAFDAQSVRPYFPYRQVQAGILKTAARLFHIEFTPVPDAQVWDPAVSTFDVFDAARPGQRPLIGRIYLDMHPREGKDKWFSSAPVIPGIRARQLPEGALLCNFPGGGAGDPGLMEFNDVVTFFHEFGHLMHHILGSQGEWSGTGGFNTEGDFIEAPSQMLEEMFHNPAILASFARHYQTGETIPASLIANMNRASAFGRAGWLQTQLVYSSFSLQLYNQAPAALDFDDLWTAARTRYRPYTALPGNRSYASFTHLTGYASNYYTYLLDKVIALDFFAQFDRKNLLDGPTAMRYRRSVLEPGASKPATELVRDFLGRPQNFVAIKSWMGEEFQTPAPAAQ